MNDCCRTGDQPVPQCEKDLLHAIELPTDPPTGDRHLWRHASCRAASPAETDGITVIGNGEAKAKPTQVEISGLVAGDAELAADAIVKYRDAKKHAVDALTNLKLASLEIISQGFTVNQAVDPNMQMQMMRGMNPGANAKAKVQVAEQMRLVLKDLDKIESEKLMDTLLKVLDTAKDNGLVVGPGLPQNYYQMQAAMQNGRGTSMISFKLPDPKDLRDAAYKDAMENAKVRASAWRICPG